MSLTMARFVEEQTQSDPSLISLNFSGGCRHPPYFFVDSCPDRLPVRVKILSLRYSYIQRNLSPHNVRRLLSRSGHGWWGVSALRCHRRSVRTDFSEADKRVCPAVARCINRSWRILRSGYSGEFVICPGCIDFSKNLHTGRG